MKRLLIPMLVLAVASMANVALAGFVPLTVIVNGPATVSFGATFTVDVVLSGLTGGEELQAITNFAIDITGVAHTTGAISINPRFDAPSVATYALMDLNSDAPAPYLANGAVLFSFDMTVYEFGYLRVDLVDANPAASLYMYAVTDLPNYSYKSLGPDYGPLTVIPWVIPEPMTIALLGLGGLLLRKKHRM